MTGRNFFLHERGGRGIINRTKAARKPKRKPRKNWEIDTAEERGTMLWRRMGPGSWNNTQVP